MATITFRSKSESILGGPKAYPSDQPLQNSMISLPNKGPRSLLCLLIHCKGLRQAVPMATYQISSRTFADAGFGRKPFGVQVS